MWEFALKENDLEENRLHRIYPKGIAVLIIKKGGRLFSLSSNCPHMGCTLGGAVVEGDVIRCPCHDWKFDISTGRFLDTEEIHLETYPCKTENGSVFINLERKKP
jgi:nitrite reductase/ring-hydroxylating ferredoxin subunit